MWLKIKYNKLGTLFIVAVLALGGVGIAYSEFSDMLHVYGKVDTATVNFRFEDFSCTYIWKIYNVNQDIEETPYFNVNQGEEIGIYTGPCINPDQFEIAFLKDKCDFERVSWASALESNEPNKIDVKYYSLFPCINFTADFILRYMGSIPGKIDWPVLHWQIGNDLSSYITLEAFSYVKNNDDLVRQEEICEDVFPYQIHPDEYIGWEVIIYLPQDNTLQNKYGEFSFDINVTQWSDPCKHDNADEDKVSVGDVIITEFMANPDVVYDRNGEWFEIYNTKNYPIDVSGWKIYDLGSNYFQITDYLTIPPQSHLVFCCNDDYGTNGGVTCNYQYDSNDFTLGNTDDEIIITTSDNLIIDEIAYNDVESGYSRQLCQLHYDHADNDNHIFWCDSTTMLPEGDYGSPGSINTECTN